MFGIKTPHSALLCLGLAFNHFSIAEEYQLTDFPNPPFSPPKGHPRLYFKTVDKERIIKNIGMPQNALAFQIYQDLNKSPMVINLKKPTDENPFNFDPQPLFQIESKAFSFALGGPREHALEAIKGIKDYIGEVKPSDYNEIGQLLFTSSEVYDWCYSELSLDDKKWFFDSFLHWAPKLEIGWPPIKQGPVIGHGPEAQFFRDLISVAVAQFDEHPELWHIVAGRFFDEFVKPKEWMYPSHMHLQGCHYANYRGQWELLAAGIFERMGYPEVFGPEQKNFLDWLLYARRPDGQTLRDGDTHMNNNTLGQYYTGAYRSFILAAGIYKDPFYKSEAARQMPGYPPKNARKNQSLSPVELLLFNDPSLDPRPISDLPLTKYFPSPKGGFIARTGWDEGTDSSSVVAEFKINEWTTTNHQHLDAGAFQIYYRGALAIDSGYYQSGINKTWSLDNNGSSGYASAHDYNYNKRTIAHNCVLVFDPDEVFTPEYSFDKSILANDGGQRWPATNGKFYVKYGQRMDTQDYYTDPENGYRIGSVLGREVGKDPIRPNFTYLKGEIGGAYSRKVMSYERTFQFLNLNNKDHPAALIVLDRIESSNPNFKKTWVLHSLEEPVISGGRTSITDSRPNYGGKLTVDTLIPGPANCDISSVGGQGKEFLVNGVNYSAALRTIPKDSDHPNNIPKIGDVPINEGGSWRLEISPRTPANTDFFLNVLQVGDAISGRNPLPVELISIESNIGVKIHDRIAIFSKDRYRSFKSIELLLTGPEIYQITIADLVEGVWVICKDGAQLGTAVSTKSGGLIEFTGPAGKYDISYLNNQNTFVPYQSSAMRAVTYPKKYVIDQSQTDNVRRSSPGK